jgi:hypothetical protein
MEGDDNQPPSWPQEIHGRRQRRLKRLELTVDSDAQCLKCARGRMNTIPASPHRLRYHLG